VHTRLRWIVLAVLVAALLPGCKAKPEPEPAAPPATGKAALSTAPAVNAADVTIGFLVKQPEEPWFQNEWKFAEDCAKKYGFKLSKMGAENGEKVLANIDTLHTQGAQGFIICTPDVKLGPAIMAKAKQYDMKVIAVDDQFVDKGEFMDVHYMGIAARKIGEMMGQAAYDEFQKRGWKTEETGLCVVTYEQLDTARERTDGAIDVISKAGFPKERIFKAAERTTDVPGAMEATLSLLTQHPEVKKWLAVSMNDEGVLGAVRAMEQRGFDEDTIIGVGIGGTTALAEFDKPEATGFFATCLINPYRHGFETSEMMFKWITEGTEPPKTTLTEATVVTRETCRQVMTEQGLLD